MIPNLIKFSQLTEPQQLTFTAQDLVWELFASLMGLIPWLYLEKEFKTYITRESKGRIQAEEDSKQKTEFLRKVSHVRSSLAYVSRN